MNTEKSHQPEIEVDLNPEFLPAEWVKPGGEWLACGKCNYNGPVKHYIFVDEPICFEAVCNCPIPGVLRA